MCSRQENLKIHFFDYAHYNLGKLKLKSPSTKLDFCTLEIFSNSLFK